MRKFMLAAGVAAMAATSSFAETLQMRTLPASLPPAVVMATFANVVSSNVEGLNIEVSAGGAATAHMLEVGRGDIEMSMTSPVVWNLMNAGKRMYAKKPEAPELAKNVQLLMWYPYGQYHFTVRADSDIKTLDDLEGATVFLGPTGGGAWNGAYGWIKSTTGLDAKAGDYEAFDGNWVTGFQAFLDGTIDMYVGGCIDPCGPFLQLTETEEIRFVGPEDNTGPAVDKFLGNFRFRDSIPAGIYDGQANEADVNSWNTAVGIAVNSDVSEETVYQMTKAFWENLDSVTSTAPWASALDVNFSAKGQGGITYHPGAARYYAEIGAQ